MRLNKSNINYTVTFVPESGIEVPPVVIGQVVGVDEAIRLALGYLKGQWVGERGPGGPYEHHFDYAVRAINSMQEDHVLVTAAAVEYGCLLIH